jgi:hypothetical protein
MKTPTRIFLAAGIVAAVASFESRATLILWDGGTSAAWSDGATWAGGTAPANDTMTVPITTAPASTATTPSARKPRRSPSVS